MEYTPVTSETAYNALARHPAWVVERSRLRRDLRFASFNEALAFVNRVGEVADRLGHHPNIRIHEWCFVELEIYSHATGGLTTRDVELAVGIEGIVGDGPAPG